MSLPVPTFHKSLNSIILTELSYDLGLSTKQAPCTSDYAPASFHQPERHQTAGKDLGAEVNSLAWAQRGRRVAQLCNKKVWVCLGEGIHLTIISFQLNACQGPQMGRDAPVHSVLNEPCSLSLTRTAECVFLHIYHFTSNYLTPTPWSHTIAQWECDGE